jgi:hypothetical protein
MMAPTHALAGTLVGVAVASAFPGTDSAVLAAGYVGGLAPDLDLYADHRRRLHYPVGYGLGTAAALVALVVTPSPGGTVVLTCLAAAWVHAVADTLGGGLELRPWERTSERAVYDHVRERWLRPRRVVRYDGAPEDAFLAGGLGASVFVLTEGPVRLLVAATVIVAFLWVLVRRRVPRLVDQVLPFVPGPIQEYVPERFTEATTGSDSAPGRAD